MADQTTDAQSGEVVWEIDDLLKDPTKRAAILQHLELADFPHLTPGGMAGGGGWFKKRKTALWNAVVIDDSQKPSTTNNI